MRIASNTAISLLLAAACGCGGTETGPTGEVTGTVKLDGQPITEGTVSFYQPSTGQTGGGLLGADGQFKFDQSVLVGKYKVAFLPPPPPQPDDEESGRLANVKTQIPEWYHTPESSDTMVEVKEGENTFDFELTKKKTKKSRTTPP